MFKWWVCIHNGTSNGKILENTRFKNVWIPIDPSDGLVN